MKTNITFRKEVEVDLNAYYPNFPRKLRDAIDEAIYESLGGTRRAAMVKATSAAGLANATILKMTGSPSVRRNSKTAAVLADLKRMNGKEFLREDVVKACAQHGLTGTNAVHNLIANGYLAIVE